MSPTIKTGFTVKFLEFKEGYGEYAEDRMHNVAIPFLRKGREVLPADGEESWLIWTYGKAPLRFWSSMIVGSFFFRPIVKILVYRFKTHSSGPRKSPGIFPKSSGNFP